AAGSTADPAASPVPVSAPAAPAASTQPMRQRLAGLSPVETQVIPAGRQDGARWGFGIGRFGSEGLPIVVQGRSFPDGLAAHPPGDATPSRLVYDLAGGWTRLTGQAAINDTSDFVVQGRRGNHSPLNFVVRGDGRELWRSQPINTFDPPQPFDVAVAGVRSLELRVEIDGVFHCCQAVWLDPELSR
ncbi:MAG: NPCBM/NEW2 domain-containing protein, partial [Planctomycetes bacterium]|nr:NPCBM/NEW2 domain-containing protein [Planctomycetota bacterium]